MLVQEVLQRRRELWRWGTQWLAIWSWGLPVERIIEVDPLKPTWDVAEELSCSHSMVIWHLKQIGKGKKLDKWVPHELTANQKKKIVILKFQLLLFYAATMNHFLTGLWHVKKSGFYVTTGNSWLSDWTEKRLQSTFQSQTCTPKRIMVTGGLLPVWSNTPFWIPVKPLHLRSVLSNSMRWTKNCNAYSWHWSTERSQFFSMTASDLTSHNQCFKLNELGYKVLSHLPYSPDGLAVDYHYFKYLDNFLQAKHFHNQ